MSDNKEVLQQLGEAFAEFKKANDERLAEIQKSGDTAGSESRAKLEAIESRLDELNKTKSEIEALQVKLDSPEFSAGSEDQRVKQESEAFAAVIRSASPRKGNQGEFGAKELAEYREKAISGQSSITGGVAIPQEMSRAIVKQMANTPSVYNHVTRRDVSSINSVAVTARYATNGGWAGEEGVRSETNTNDMYSTTPTFGTVYAYPKATEESLEDLFFDVNQFLVDSATFSFNQLLAAAIISGNGTSKPTGMLVNTEETPDGTDVSPQRTFGYIEEIHSGYASSLGNDRTGSPQGDPVDLFMDVAGKLRVAYRSNASWLVNRETATTMRKYKDADGNYLWEQSVQSGQPNVFLGYPVIEEDHMPSEGTNALPVVFGDLRSAYVLAQMSGMSVTMDNITTPGYVKFYIRMRVGGIVSDDTAIKVIKCAV